MAIEKFIINRDQRKKGHLTRNVANGDSQGSYQGVCGREGPKKITYVLKRYPLPVTPLAHVCSNPGERLVSQRPCLHIQTVEQFRIRA